MNRWVWPVLLSLLLACQKAPGEKLTVRMNPQGNAPLSALVQLETGQPVKPVKVQLQGGVDSEVSASGFAPSHQLAVVGFRPATRHEVRVIYETEEGQRKVSKPVSVETAPLPSDFPQVESRKSAPSAELEGGYLLLGLSPLEPAEPMAQSGMLLLLDEEGQVLWFWETESSIGEIEQLPNGHILVQKMKDLCHQEIDWTGRVVRSWQATGLRQLGKGQTAVEVESFHHDFQTTARGAYALASLRSGDQIDEMVIHYQESGLLDLRLELSPLLSPKRKIHPDFPNFYEFFYGRGVTDWGHANSLVVDEDSQTAVVSLAYQDAIVKFDLAERKPVWILGRPDKWGEEWKDLLLQPRGELVWPTRQHSAVPTSQGTWLCFDNGSEFSRAVEYRVDEKAMTVEQIWEFRGQEPFHSNLLGDVRQLSQTGNIQIVDGARRTEGIRRWARILEVSHSAPSKLLWELTFRRPGTLGCSVYRALRLSDLPRAQRY